MHVCLHFNSYLASGDFCCLLITLTNSLDPDQDQHSVGPDLDPNCLKPIVSDTYCVPERILQEI